MNELGEIAILNKNSEVESLVLDVSGMDKMVMSDCSLGIKADLLYQKGLYKVISEDIVNESLNKLACYGGEISSFAYHISVKEPNSEDVGLVVDALQSELNRSKCDKILKNLAETGYNIDKFDINTVVAGKAIREIPNVISGDIIIGLTTDRINFGLYPLLLEKYKSGLLSGEEFDECLKPALSYHREIIDLYKKNKIKDCVYINAKSIKEQINKQLPNGLACDINIRHIPNQPIIDKLSEIDGINYYEQYGAGICCCLITDKASNEIFFEDCQKFNPFVFGTIE